jgi:putative intracellular protease/amidase
MKNSIKTLLIIFSCILPTLNYASARDHGDKTTNKQQTEMKNKKVLIIVTSVDLVKSNGKKTGLWLEEFATPYYIFKEQGYEITVASPKGGVAPIDPKSKLPEYTSESVKKFLEDPSAQEKLNTSSKLTDVNVNEFDAVFYPGGTGPVWDLPDNPQSVKIIEYFYDAGKPTALVCHAPAALKNVKDTNGSLLIKGKNITGFTNSEEAAGHTEDMVPFSVENMLKERGAIYQSGEIWKGFLLIEKNLITGQNPASADLAAQKVIELLNTSK